jgi:hypothetical protein
VRRYTRRLKSPKPARYVRQPCFLSGKSIRTENTVMDKDGAGVLHEIVDWARMGFSSAQHRNFAIVWRVI